MPKVLLICEYPELNGAERSLLALLPQLMQRGHQFLAAAPAEGPLADRLAALGIPVYPLATHDARGVRRWQHELRRDLAALFANVEPDVVHANSLATARLSGPVAAAAGLPSLGHIRDIVRLSGKAVADVNRHRRLLVVSRTAHRWHAAQGLDAQKLHVLHNGVDLERFRPAAPTGLLHRERQLAADVRLVGAIGQVTLRKGVDVLVESASLLAAERPDVHFVFVGSRHGDKPENVALETQLVKAASQGPLAGRFHLLGRREDVPELLRELTVLVHPARQEPLGRVLLEAAASGTPVVATRVGGTPEIFGEDRAAALLVAPDDPSALAAGLLQMLDDARLARSMAADARRRAERLFDAEQAAAGLASHYRAVGVEA